MRNRIQKGFALTLLATAAVGACSRGPSADAIQIDPVSRREARSLALRIRSGNVPLPSEEKSETPEIPEDISPECQTFLGEIPKYFFKGFVEVPENWDLPDGRKIKVFYYGKLEGNDRRRQKPVVFFNGGPSMDSHASSGLFETSARASQVPFIYIDQRGTGCSDPYPADPTEENLERLSHYGTRSIVKDAEAVRAAVLGGKKWRAFGQSYGGMIVQRYITVAPEGIESAYAHGFSVISDSVEFFKFRMLAQKRVTEDYFKVFPRDRERLEKLKSLINADTCFTDGVTRICGNVVLDAATLMLGFRPNWDGLHEWFVNLLNKDGQLHQRNLQKFVRAFIFGAFAANALPSAVINKVEILDGTDNDQCGAAMDRLKRDGEDPQAWPLNECRLLSNITSDEIEKGLRKLKARDPLELDALAEALRVNPELRFYLYSGGMDTFVPMETFAREAARLGSRITYRNFPDSGHEGFFTESEIWEELLQ